MRPVLGEREGCCPRECGWVRLDCKLLAQCLFKAHLSLLLQLLALFASDCSLQKKGKLGWCGPDGGDGTGWPSSTGWSCTTPGRDRTTPGTGQRQPLSLHYTRDRPERGRIGVTAQSCILLRTPYMRRSPFLL